MTLSLCLPAAGFVTGVALLVTSYFVEIPTQLADVRAGAILMAATFGVFHLLYALKIFCSSEDDQSEIEPDPEVPADGAVHD